MKRRKVEKRKSPWKGLDSYQEGDAIYGRDAEIIQIFNGIYTNLQTVIYGKSGIGKTSLLQAGVYPLLRKERFFPVPVRLGIMVDEESYIDATIKAIQTAATEELSAFGKPSLRISTIAKQTNDEEPKLWSYLLRTQFIDDKGNTYSPVLIYDQFEEILNNSGTYDRAVEFLLSLYSLLDDSRAVPVEYLDYSNYRIVISMREDYLYCLEDIIDKYNLTELRYNRFRMHAMSEKEAEDVVMKTMGDIIEEDSKFEICKSIIDITRNNVWSNEIDSLILSLTGYVLCDNYTIIKKEHLKDLDKTTDWLIWSYYRKKVNILQLGVRSSIFRTLLTKDGRRTSIDINDALGIYSSTVLDYLKDNKIIRYVSYNGSYRIELIHDKIASIIYSHNRTNLTFINAITPNFNGYVGPVAYILAVAFLTCCFLPFCMIYISLLIYDPLGDFNLSVFVLLFFVLYFYILILFTSSIKRLHDAGKSGLWLLLPVINVVYLLKPSSKHKYEGKLTKLFQTMGLQRNEYIGRFISMSLMSIIWIITYFLIYYIVNAFLYQDSIYFKYNNMFIASSIYLFIIIPISCMPPRLRYLGYSQWWALCPIVNIILFFYLFMPDSYFEKRKIAKQQKHN